MADAGPAVADRLFEVLDHCAVAARPLSLAELVERTGWPKTTTHRVCHKLAELGALEREDGGFRLGTRLFALGGLQPEIRRLRAASAPFLHHLSATSGWMANLAVRSGDAALLVEEVSGSGRLPTRMVGTTMPLHATAVGKALLSGCDAREVARLAGPQGFAPFTRATRIRPEVLAEHLAGVRAAGVAFSSEEWRFGAAGVAAPVVVGGAVVAAVALVGPPDARLLRQLALPVQQVARELAATLEAQAGAVTAPAG